VNMTINRGRSEGGTQGYRKKTQGTFDRICFCTMLAALTQANKKREKGEGSFHWAVNE